MEHVVAACHRRVPPFVTCQVCLIKSQNACL